MSEGTIGKTNTPERPMPADAGSPRPPPGAAGKRTARSNRFNTANVMVTFISIVATLYFGREVLVPVTLALLLTFLLAPAVDLFRRFYLGRVPSVVLVVTLALAILTGIGAVVVVQLRELAGDLPHYVTAIESKVATIKTEALAHVSGVMKLVGPVANSPNQAAPGPVSSPPFSAAAVTTQAAQTPAAPSQVTSSPWADAAGYIAPVLSPLATFGIVFVVTIFALLQREDLRDRLIRLLGANDIQRTTIALDDAGRRLKRYFLTQLSINTIFGLVIGIGLYFIGVPKPILWGLLTAILRFIPYFGSSLSALMPIALAAAVEPGWTMAIYTLIFYVIAEGLTGQVLEPLLYGQSSGLSPFSVITAAIFWSWVWGPVGLFLATPLTLCLVVLGRHVKGLEFLDVALGDRPPLTPAESFYQRILADDADEILAQAEAMLKDMPLTKYYDDVALPGMQLAANDVALGSLTDEQQDSVKATIYELVAGLSETMTKKHLADSAAPAASQVLSIAGRGPLDEPAASMLVQLLEQRGIGGRMVKYRDVSRYSIETLEVKNVALVCIAYLNISGNPAHLRYLVQRLRKILPVGTPILVGLWPLSDTAIKDAQMASGADYFANSFEDILNECETANSKQNTL